jgi:SulP family sulfate permease
VGIAALFGWHGMELGELDEAVPPFVGFTWGPGDVHEVLPEAFALALATSVNLLVTSRVVEHFRGVRARVKAASADAELGAYSMANLFAGMFGAPMSVGIPARSLANVRCGGVTRMSNLLHAAYLAAFIFFAKDWIGEIPLPALAGVTAWMGIALLDWSTWRRLHRMRREEAAAFVVTAGGVLIVNAVIAVAAGYFIHVVGAYLQRSQIQGSAARGAIERTSWPGP